MIRLASANLLFGMSLTTGRSDPGAVVSAIAALDADIIAIQEVDRFQGRSGTVDQTAMIGAATGMSWCFAPAIIGEPGGDWRAAGADDLCSLGTGGVERGDPGERGTLPVGYGVGLLTRLPVRSWHRVVLRAAPVRSPILIPGSRRLVMLRDEPRVAIVAVVEWQARSITVVATHLSFVPGWNIRQLRIIRRALTPFPEPCVLLGDLNLPGPVPAKVLGWTSLLRRPTFPSPSPRVQLDHVLVRDRHALHVCGTDVVQLPISDHRAVVVDVRLADRSAVTP